jgi:hypothetical protein
MCQQWVNECLDLITKKNDDSEEKQAQGNLTRTQTDDETKFERIPIAGENESNYENSDEYEEDKDSWIAVP